MSDQPEEVFSPYAQFGPPVFSAEFLAHLRRQPKTPAVERPPLPIPPPEQEKGEE